jgi:hypothetical protein
MQEYTEREAKQLEGDAQGTQPWVRKQQFNARVCVNRCVCTTHSVLQLKDMTDQKRIPTHVYV